MAYPRCYNCDYTGDDFYSNCYICQKEICSDCRFVYDVPTRDIRVEGCKKCFTRETKINLNKLFKEVQKHRDQLLSNLYKKHPNYCSKKKR